MVSRFRLDEEKEMMIKSDDEEEFVDIEPILPLETDEKVKEEKD